VILIKDDDTKEDNMLYKWVNALNNHMIDDILSFLSDDIGAYDTIYGYLDGKENVEFLHSLFHAFPNLYIELISVISYNKKVIVEEIKLEGNPIGEFNGNPEFGNNFTIYSVFIFNLNKLGKILKIKIYYDSRSFYRQLQILKF
jgi:steroid delta-isomerase-like uncharacterized protein